MLARLLLIVGILAVTAALGAWWRARDGRVRGAGHVRLDPDLLDAVGLPAAAPGGAALLIGSPTCAPCVTVKAVLAEVAERRSDFRWRYVDAADHRRLVTDHRVRRVPTLFVLDRDGTILARSSGVPTRRDVLDVLDGRARLPA